MAEIEEEKILFSLTESVAFKKGMAVRDIRTLSLEPIVGIEEQDDEIVLKGYLQLYGEYDPDLTVSGEKEGSLRDVTAVRTIDEIDVDTNGIWTLKHQFPLDVQIPKNKVGNIEDLAIRIQMFDYDLTAENCLEIQADIEISGIHAQKVMEEKETQTKVEREVIEDEMHVYKAEIPQIYTEQNMRETEEVLIEQTQVPNADTPSSLFYETEVHQSEFHSFNPDENDLEPLDQLDEERKNCVQYPEEPIFTDALSHSLDEVQSQFIESEESTREPKACFTDSQQDKLAKWETETQLTNSDPNMINIQEADALPVEFKIQKTDTETGLSSASYHQPAWEQNASLENQTIRPSEAIPEQTQPIEIPVLVQAEKKIFEMEQMFEQPHLDLPPKPKAPFTAPDMYSKRAFFASEVDSTDWSEPSTSTQASYQTVEQITDSYSTSDVTPADLSQFSTDRQEENEQENENMPNYVDLSKFLYKEVERQPLDHSLENITPDPLESVDLSVPSSAHSVMDSTFDVLSEDLATSTEPSAKVADFSRLFSGLLKQDEQHQSFAKQESISENEQLINHQTKDEDLTEVIEDSEQMQQKDVTRKETKIEQSDVKHLAVYDLTDGPQKVQIDESDIKEQIPSSTENMPETETPVPDNALYLAKLFQSKEEKRTQMKIYFVQQGDSVQSLAIKFNVPIHHIHKCNQLTEDELCVGQPIYIPIKEVGIKRL